MKNIIILVSLLFVLKTVYSDNKTTEYVENNTSEHADNIIPEYADNNKLNTTNYPLHAENDREDNRITTKNAQNNNIGVGSKGKSEKNYICLTGYMTDVQNWVDENGDLSTKIERRNSIDVSKKQDVVVSLSQEIQEFKSKEMTREVKYLSLAKCRLRRVPTVFHLEDVAGRALYSTIEYLTLYGNEFTDLSAAGEQYGEYLNATDPVIIMDANFQTPASSSWALGFNEVTFSKLKQLDLRRCLIQTLTYNIFKNMPKLEALYLGENVITYVSAQAFNGLKNLVHLDMSRNLVGYDNIMVFEHAKIFSELQNLRSLDLSMTQIAQRNANIFGYITGKLQRLSICASGLAQLPPGIFNHTNLKYLDVSSNAGILNRNKPLEGLEDKLIVVYAKRIALKNVKTFYKFDKLLILDVEGNEITAMSKRVAQYLTNLRILNLDSNRVVTWFDQTFSYMKQLKLLSLRDNNINLLSTEMIVDFQNISYIGLSENFIVCNCHTRELFELAYRNQNKTAPQLLTRRPKILAPFNYHRGFDDFTEIISQRKNVTRYCEKELCSKDADLESEGDFILFDFDANLYQCLLISEAKSVPFSYVETCSQSKREINFEEVIEESWTKLFLLFIIPVVVFPLMAFFYVFRRNLKYFLITMRNSATLSLINKDKVVDDDTIFNYDVFVSYCNEDRIWVLDQLLPHVEKDCNVSVCLHERDFQVGLSILENIVSCMDRSRSIMLIISQRFLLSQWCQFEMHLAQHRLLETRREDLILVLLEDIPRQLRPTTLHYLMLTKTYIVWPKNEREHTAFWRRLNRSILTYRIRGQENISLA